MAQTENTDDLKDKKLESTGTTGNTGDAVDKQDDGGESKMITEEEAQRRADAQVAKKLKGMPTKEEIAAFREWKESQKTDDEKRAEAEKRYVTLEAENTALKQEKMVLAKGVKLDDADYVFFKVSRMEGDFEENLEQFLSEHPKFLGDDESSQPKRTGVSVHGSNQPKTSGVDEILKKRNPNLEI